MKEARGQSTNCSRKNTSPIDQQKSMTTIKDDASTADIRGMVVERLQSKDLPFLWKFLKILISLVIILFFCGFTRTRVGAPTFDVNSYFTEPV